MAAMFIFISKVEGRGEEAVFSRAFFRQLLRPLTGDLTDQDLIKSPSLLGPYGLTGKLGVWGYPPSRTDVTMKPFNNAPTRFSMRRMYSYSYLHLSTPKTALRLSRANLRLTATNCD